jgi:hypothetical protein
VAHVPRVFVARRTAPWTPVVAEGEPVAAAEPAGKRPGFFRVLKGNRGSEVPE